MTARFLLNLREWDHRMSNLEIDQWQWDILGGEGTPLSAMQFKKSEPRTAYESPLGARSYMRQKSNAKRAGISRDGTWL